MTWKPSISAANPLSEVLDQLRDIHEPAAPGLWPIPVGWWGVAVLSFAILMFGSWVLLQERRRRQPYIRIRKSVRQLNDQRNAGSLDSLEYAMSVNLLFKELVVKIEGHEEATQLYGSRWLDFLAERFNNRAFVDGPGRCLGSNRYMEEAFSDAGLQDLVKTTLQRAAPLRRITDA